MRTAVTVVVVAASVGLPTALLVWLSWRSPADLSEVDSPLRPRIADGAGRPAGPDAEAMGVLDRGVIVTGPPPPDGVPTDAPRPRPAPRRLSRRRRRWPRRPAVRSRPSGPSTGQAAGGGPTPASSVAPADIVVAFRGLERRYRELFDTLGEEETPDDVAHRRAPDGWSVIDHVVAATRAIAAADRALRTVLTAESPTVSRLAVEPGARPAPAGPSVSLDDVLADLGRVATAAAERVARVPAEEWSRTATVDDGSGRTLTALDIARAAVDAGVTHLRAAACVLDAVRTRP